MKASEEFTRLISSFIVMIAYLLSFYWMTLVLRFIPIGIAYAIWSGIGIVLVTMIGKVLYQQTPDLPAIIGMVLIISGVIVIHLFSKTIS
ncbi:MAG: SMR family transporter [Mariprofundaceae bacterium]|nr:SMR family transporter [Mariprofundaceae bacterium]